MMRNREMLSLTAFVIALAAFPANAEKPDLSQEKLRQLATHVVTGEVVAIYEQEPKKVGNYNRTYYVAEVKTANCEKGEGIDQGDLIYVRYWRQGWAGPGPVRPGTSGHRGLPDEGDMMRIYLAKNAYDGFSRQNTDGGYNVIGANGFEELSEEG